MRKPTSNAGDKAFTASCDQIEVVSMTSETGINGEAPAFIHLPVERSVDAVVGKQDCGHEWRIGIKRQFGAKPQEFVGSGFDAKTYR